MKAKMIVVPSCTYRRIHFTSRNASFCSICLSVCLSVCHLPHSALYSYIGTW